MSLNYIIDLILCFLILFINGYLIKQGDLNQLVNKILFLYENKDKRKIFGQNGHNRVLEKFTWKIIIKDYINLFKKVLTT
jgi:glycosyltransferase involved in cell wall biosynthesis